MDESTTAVGIDVFNEEQFLKITWEDGVISHYPLYGLRKNCPCVMCRGGHDQMQNFEPGAFFLENPPRMNIKGLKPVGNHALQITWIDGHNSGMYRWDTLRWLDPENHK